MTLSLGRRLISVGFMLALAASELTANQGRPQRFFWWRSEHVKQELGLNADQVARVEKIHQSTIAELRQEFDELDRLDAKLTRLIESDADEALITRQIDRVETARANLNKTRSLMLYRMRQVLTPDQQRRLKTLQGRAEQQRGSSSEPRRPGVSSGTPRPDTDKPPEF